MIDLPPDALFFQARITKDGPFVGVAVWTGPPLVDGEELDRSHRLQCLIRNETTARAVLTMGVNAPVEIDGAFLRNIQPTSRSNYTYLVAHSSYSTAHAPSNPDASPTEAVDFMKIQPF